MSSETKAFVAGATGYTGRAVVDALRARGCAVVAHVRPKSRQLTEWTTRFEGSGAIVDATPWELEAMTASLREHQPSVVFALLGTTRKRAKGEGMGAREAYERIDYGLSRMLLDACVAAAPSARFVYLSSAGVSEGSANPYLQARERVEAALRESGLAFTIARPSFITGSDRDEVRPAERVGALVGDGFLGVLGAVGAKRLRDRFRSTDSTELAAALVRHALDPSSAGRVLHGEDLR